MLRDIEGWEGRYRVSDDGRVWSCRSAKFLRPGRTSAGYRTVNLCRDGKPRSAYVHILVAQAFIQNPDGKPTVNHKRGTAEGDAVGNLEWMTYSENHKHAYAVLGRRRVAKPKGADSPVARVVAALDGEVFGSVSEAAKSRGVSASAIVGSIRRGGRSGGTRWAYV